MEVITRNEVIEAAREFGEALADCEECRAVKQAQEALRKDRGARKLISDYQSIQSSIQMARMWNKKIAQDELNELMRLETEINSNPIIQSFVNAQKRLREMLVNLNEEVSGLLGIDFASNSTVGGCC